MEGKTYKEFASEVDVVYQTLLDWCDKYPDFKVAYARAKQEMENYLVRIGRAGLTGEKIYNKRTGRMQTPYFNTAVWIFMLKARFGWRENDMVVEDEESELEFTD